MGRWRAKQLDQLVGKVNGYLAWIQTGGCVQSYPDAAHGVDILISRMDEPVDGAKTLLTQIHDLFAERYGIGAFYQAVFPG